MTEEHKRKISEANKGKRKPSLQGELNPAKRPEIRAKISVASLGKKKSAEHVEKIRAKNIGRKLTEEHKKKIGDAHRGEKNSKWKGGISKNPDYRRFCENKRRSLKVTSGSYTFGEWEMLKSQYNFTCPSCLKAEPEIKLTADHIVPLSRGGSNNIENIQPLCMKCNCSKHTKVIMYAKPI